MSRRSLSSLTYPSLTLRGGPRGVGGHALGILYSSFPARTLVTPFVLEHLTNVSDQAVLIYATTCLINYSRYNYRARFRCDLSLKVLFMSMNFTIRSYLYSILGDTDTIEDQKYIITDTEKRVFSIDARKL